MDLKDMSGEGRAERKKRQTRQKIIQVAIELFHRQGFDNTTMEQIAEETDIARKTLYNHFPVKEAIVDEYVRGISKGLAQETFKAIQDLPDTKSRLLLALDKAYKWVEINQELTKVALGYRLKNLYQESNYKETGTQEIMAYIIGQGQISREIRQDIPLKLLVAQLDVLRSTIVFDWVNDSSRFELRKEIAKIVDQFLYGAIVREDSLK